MRGITKKTLLMMIIIGVIGCYAADIEEIAKSVRNDCVATMENVETCVFNGCLTYLEEEEYSLYLDKCCDQAKEMINERQQELNRPINLMLAHLDQQSIGNSVTKDEINHYMDKDYNTWPDDDGHNPWEDWGTMPNDPTKNMEGGKYERPLKDGFKLICIEIAEGKYDCLHHDIAEIATTKRKKNPFTNEEIQFSDFKEMVYKEDPVIIEDSGFHIRNSQEGNLGIRKDNDHEKYVSEDNDNEQDVSEISCLQMCLVKYPDDFDFEECIIKCKSRRY